MLGVPPTITKAGSKILDAVGGPWCISILSILGTLLYMLRSVLSII